MSYLHPFKCNNSIEVVTISFTMWIVIAVTSFSDIFLVDNCSFEDWSWTSKSTTLCWATVSFSWRWFSELLIWCCRLQDPGQDTLDKIVHCKMDDSQWTSKINTTCTTNHGETNRRKAEKELIWASLCLRTFPETVKAPHSVRSATILHCVTERAASPCPPQLCAVIFPPSIVTRLHLGAPDNDTHSVGHPILKPVKYIRFTHLTQSHSSKRNYYFPKMLDNNKHFSFKVHRIRIFSMWL